MNSGFTSNKTSIWLIEGKYRDRTADPLLTAAARALVEGAAGELRSLGDRAKAADDVWRPRIAELQPEHCAFAEIYAWAFTHYSWATHALQQPLYRFVGLHPNGGVFVGHEDSDQLGSAWAMGLLVYGLALLVSAETFGWPDAGEVRALLKGVSDAGT